MNPEKSPLLLASAKDLLSFSLENKFLRNENFSETACSCKRECLISSNAGCSRVNLA